MKKLSTAQLSEYLAVTKRTVQRRANRESWLHEIEVGLGGERRLYIFERLPASVKQTVIANIIAKHEKHGLNFRPSGDGGRIDSALDMKDTPFIVLEKYDSQDWVTQHSFAHKVDIAELNKEYVRQGLLVMAKLYVVHFDFGKIKGFDRFCDLYNQRALAINDLIYSVVKHVSRISLLRWEKQLTHGAGRTLPLSSNDSGPVTFDLDLQQMAHELLLISPNLTARRLRQHFVTVFTERKLPTESELAVWIEQMRRSK